MFNKILLSLLAVALVLPLNVSRATNPVWFVLDATDVWDYGTHRVERLKLPKIVDGPFNLGDNVLVQTVASTCVNAECGERDAYILRNGSAIRVPNVPKSALDAEMFRANGGRVVWTAEVPNDQERYDVIELDLTSGTKQTLASNLFVGGTETMKVFVKDKEIFLNPTFNFDNHNGFKNAAVLRYNKASGMAENITKRWVAQHEDLLDIDLVNNRILTKMTFAGGEKELWLTKITSQYLNGEANRIINTWTPVHEDIVGSHFRSDGSVEYFRMYTRGISVTDKGVETLATVPLEENLTWTRPVTDSIFVADDQMIYVNKNGELSVDSPAFGTVRMGLVGTSPILVNGSNMFYTTADGSGAVYDLVKGSTVNLDYRPNDQFGTAVVGVDADGAVQYTNTETDRTVVLGFGTLPTLSDARHIYWRGVDGMVYEVTIASSPNLVGNETIEAVKTEGSHTVFLTDGVRRWTIPSDEVFFTWFDSWDDVRTVSAVRLAQYRDMGPARFAPGTKVKADDDVRTYVIGRDNKAHWIINETVADAIYGSSWNKNIHAVPSSVMMTYGLGRTIDDVMDADLI